MQYTICIKFNNKKRKNPEKYLSATNKKHKSMLDIFHGYFNIFLYFVNKLKGMLMGWCLSCLFIYG